MKIAIKIISLSFVFVISLTIFGSVISANLQDHSQMMTEGSCADAEECIFHQARSVFENNALSTTSPIQLAVLLVTGLLAIFSTIYSQSLNPRKFVEYELKLLRYRNKWARYLQRSTDRLKISPTYLLI